jgi:hypothetical protein
MAQSTEAATSIPQTNPQQLPKKATVIAPRPITAVAKPESSKHKPDSQRTTKSAASRPTKFLPSERITFTRQLDILRGWAAASGPLRKAVTNVEVGKIVDMQPSTVSMNNAFYASVGLLSKSEGGYAPAEDVMAFLRAYDWNKETAAQKLAPVLSKAWFYQALASKLEFGARTEADCLQDLGDAANAGQDYKNNLKMLLEYLLAVGLVQRDGSLIKKGSVGMTTSSSSSAPADDPSPTTTKPESGGTLPDSTKSIPSLFGTTEGQVQFNIAVKVNMGEFATWQADRIASFFSGIAQVLAAKAKVEQSE